MLKNNGGEFVKLRADQEELALSHSRIPTVYRHEISKISARLCIAQLEEDMTWLFSLIGLADFLARGRWPQYAESVQVYINNLSFSPSTRLELKPWK
ncbi:hypothetical protein D5086_017675 [Populus alba]|uniref:Uncharacterized protein n=2 Tax=Populus TaxID=3689 RepID=A0ACC4BMS3_POPAL|nr:hypothetical protein NC653_022567 [Populus alba x Populus x berolinensis]